MFTEIVTVHVTAPGHKELLTVMFDATSGYLATMNAFIVA